MSKTERERAPGVDMNTIDDTFRASELKRVDHLIINAILYATSAADAFGDDGVRVVACLTCH